jgi:phosphoglycerate-specific signal transduction histidine kinase
MQKETYIWGAGHYGVLAALNCEQKNIKVAGFIDTNANKIKTRLGLLVLAPEEIYKKQEEKQILIAIQNKNAIKEIAANLKSNRIYFEISNMILRKGSL